MTLGERIKKVRKDKGLTQQKFANQIGTTQNNIASYEIGRREPSAAAVNNICKTFNINEEWLREGKGEMYGPKPTAALELLALDHKLTNGDYLLIEKFLNLKPEMRRALIDYIREVAAAITSAEADGVSPEAPASASFQQAGIPITDAEIKTHATMYEERAQDDAYSQLQQAEVDPELDAEVEAFRQRRIQEKKQESQTSAAKESGLG